MADKLQKVELNSDAIKDLINHTIQNNKFLQEKGLPTTALEVVGESGIGKTSMVLDCCRDFGIDFRKINLAQLDELGDLVGFPIREFEYIKDGDPHWVNEKELDLVGKNYALTGKKRTSYCPPSWVPEHNKGGILLLDDWNRADVRFIQACMELIDRGEYISWKLPPGWTILLTSNPEDGEYIVNSIDNAQKTRYASVNMKFDAATWARWAETAEIDSRCINFILLNDEAINNRINARIATTFFNSISSLHPFENHYDMINLLGNSTVDQDFTQMFILFINNKLDKIPSPKDLMGKGEEQVKQLMSCVGDSKDKNYRADIAKVISTRLLNYISKLTIEKGRKEFTKDEKERIKFFLKEPFFKKDIIMFLAKEFNKNNKLTSIYQDKDIRKVL